MTTIRLLLIATIIAGSMGMHAMHINNMEQTDISIDSLNLIDHALISLDDDLYVTPLISMDPPSVTNEEAVTAHAIPANPSQPINQETNPSGSSHKHLQKVNASLLKKTVLKRNKKDIKSLTKKIAQQASSIKQHKDEILALAQNNAMLSKRIEALIWCFNDFFIKNDLERYKNLAGAFPALVDQNVLHDE